MASAAFVLLHLATDDPKARAIFGFEALARLVAWVGLGVSTGAVLASRSEETGRFACAILCILTLCVVVVANVLLPDWVRS